MSSRVPVSLPVRASLVIATAFFFPTAAAAQEAWDVPEEARAAVNPVPPGDAAVEAGRPLYTARCASCHGDTGKGDGRATRFIKPAPADISTAEARDRMTDGEIFYKITEGKKPMPGMKRTLSDEERWQVVHFLRSLQPPR